MPPPIISQAMLARKQSAGIFPACRIFVPSPVDFPFGRRPIARCALQLHPPGCIDLFRAIAFIRAPYGLDRSVRAIPIVFDRTSPPPRPCFDLEEGLKIPCP
jgi:hypothetical protein